MFGDTPLIMVEDAETLRQVADKLARQPVIGIDTESDSFYHYQEKVCLIQFSDMEQDYIVDPLSIDDLGPLAQVLQQRSTCKVLHGGDYDVVCLRRDFDFRIRNMFDTMIAAQMLGMERIGLADLIGEHYGVEIDKQYQRHNWAARPLLHEHLEYARGDTHWLISLREILTRRLRRAGRLGHVREECLLLEKRQWQRAGFDPDGYLFLKQASDLDDRAKRVLRRLYLYRDTQAREMDRPSFKVMPDSVLLAVARNQPTDGAALDALFQRKTSMKRRHGQSIVQAVRQGIQDDYEIPRQRRKKKKTRKKPKRPPVLTGRSAERVMAALKSWRNQLVKSRSDLNVFTVASNSVLTNIARYRPTTLQELAEVPDVRRWQVSDFGEEILAVLDRVNPSRGQGDASEEESGGDKKRSRRRRRRS